MALYDLVLQNVFIPSVMKIIFLRHKFADFPAQIHEKLHYFSSKLFPSPFVSKSIPSYMKSLINPSQTGDLTMTSPSPQPGPPNFLAWYIRTITTPISLPHPPPTHSSPLLSVSSTPLPSTAHLPSPTSIFGSNSAKFLKVSAYIVFLQVCDCSS